MRPDRDDLKSPGSNVNVLNSGEIIVNGSFGTSPLMNVAIDNTATSGSVINSGTITLQGINNIGIRSIRSAAGTATITSSGIINVAGGANPTSGLRNYGIWSEGTNSNVNLSGAVNLSGDGAIGVHARNKGTLTVSGNGAVNFSSGKNQIGYFAYGVGSGITNTSSSTQDVSTEGSTLFRMEDGADFTGGSGATSTLKASGKNATAINVTGRTGNDVSAFNSGNITLNLTGNGATGVRVEGGAQGKITSEATINLTGIGAIAGIADGQKHDLSGASTGTPIAGTLKNSTLDAGASDFGTGTILVSAANLDSILNNVTGYIARNQAYLENSGNIAFTGTDATGILVEAGASGSNSGNIEIGAGGTGIAAHDTAGTNITTVNSSGNMTLNGGSTANRTTGISASGARTTVRMTGGSFTMNGDGAVGVRARSGATVNLATASLPVFSLSATDQILFHLSGANSRIQPNLSVNQILDASGERSTIYRLDEGIAVDVTNTLRASGKDATAIYASGTGTTVTLQNTGTLDLTGAGAQGLFVAGGAQATLASGATINLTGAGSLAGTVDGNEYALEGGNTLASDTGSKLNNAATLTSAQANARGFVAQNQGTLVNTGNITLSGNNSQAVRVLGGNLQNEGNITANGTAVYVEGSDAMVDNQNGQILATDGRAAIELGTGANLNLQGSGADQAIEGQGTAHGVLIGTGAAGLNVKDAHIVVDATGASGNGIENAAEISNIQLNNTTIDVANGAGLRTATSINPSNSGTINVSGSGRGIDFRHANASQTSNSLDLSRSQALQIIVTGADGRGIEANTSGDINTAVTVDVRDAAGGSALFLHNAGHVTNSGSLQSNSTAAATVTANGTSHFTNTEDGNIGTTATDGVAMQFGDQDKILDNAGTITGAVRLDAGQSTLNNTGSGTITGNITSTGPTQINMEGGAITGNIQTGANIDRLVLNSGTITGTTHLGDGNDTLIANGGAYVGAIKMGNGSDTVTFNAGVDLSRLTMIDGDGARDTAPGIINTLNLNNTLTGSATGTGVAGNASIINLDIINLGNGTHNSRLNLTGDINNGWGDGSVGQMNIANNATLALTGSTTTANVGYNVRNAGTVDLTESGISPQGSMRIAGNYTGVAGSRLLVKSTWNDADVQENDRLVINGNASGNTRVSVPGNIIGGNVTLTTNELIKGGKWLSPVIALAGSDDGENNGLTFVGTANTTNAGQAQLLKVGRNYYWTLGSCPAGTTLQGGLCAAPTAILAPSVAGYTQTPRINREMGFAQMGQLHTRVGEQQTWVWDSCGKLCNDYRKLVGDSSRPYPVWGRMSLGAMDEQGEERFGYNSKNSLLQFGVDVSTRTADNGSRRYSGVMLSYGHSDNSFYDKNRSLHGIVSADKYTGSGNSDMFSIGGYSTWYGANGSYVDLVGNVSALRNKYNSTDGEKGSQNGFGAGISLEAGYPWQIGSSNWQIEPQAQLAYQYTRLNSFNDGVRNISAQDDGTLRGRLGVRMAWNADNGQQRTNSFYGILNVLHDFTGNSSSATVGLDKIQERYARTWGEVGIGGQLPLGKSTYLFGDVRYERALGGYKNNVFTGNSTSRSGYSGRIGVRHQW